MAPELFYQVLLAHVLALVGLGALLWFRRGIGALDLSSYLSGAFVPLKTCILLDVMAVGLVVPLLPFRARTVGLSAVEWGAVSMFYGALQVVSGPMVALLSQRLGRKTSLVISMLGTSVSYLMLFYTQTPIMFLMR